VVAGRIGATAILAGWFYTGGRDRTGTSASVNCSCLSTSALWRRSAPPTSTPHRAESVVVLGVATGFMACALLEANNLRDVEGDRSSGKKTLAANESWTRAVAVRDVRARVLVAIAGPDTSWSHRGDPALHSCGPPGVLEQERTRALADVEVFGASPVATRALLAVVLVFRIGL